MQLNLQLLMIVITTTSINILSGIIYRYFLNVLSFKSISFHRRGLLAAKNLDEEKHLTN